MLVSVLNKAGYDGTYLLAKANEPAAREKLRENTAAAKLIGICGVPTYRILRITGNGYWEPYGGLIWGQDEINVVEDLIAGWDAVQSLEVAEPRRMTVSSNKVAKL